MKEHQWALWCIVLWVLLGGCKKPPTPPKARSYLDIFPLLQDRRWAWGQGAPSLLLRGHFTQDKREDVLIVAEPITKQGAFTQHFFLLRGPATSPAALSAPKISIVPSLKGYTWGEKILRVTAAKTADFNQDGKLDVAVAYRNGRIALFLGDGRGETFRLVRILSVAEGTGFLDNPQLALGDWTGDDKLDLLLVGRTGVVVLWHQRPNLSFEGGLLIKGPRLNVPRLKTQLFQSWPMPNKGRIKGSVSSASRPTHAARLSSRRSKRESRSSVSSASRPTHAAPITLTLPDLIEGREAIAFNAGGTGQHAQDLLLVGLDQDHHVRLWSLRNRRDQRGSMALIRAQFLSASWPHITPISNPSMQFIPFGARHPALFLLGYQFGDNLRGVAWLRHLPRRTHPKNGRLFGPTKNLIFWENATSLGLTAGRFGPDKRIAVVLLSPYRFIGYTRNRRIFSYDLRKDPLLRGRLSLRAGVGCDLNGDGRDALVMLSVGGYGTPPKLGIQLLLYRAPFWR